MCERVCFYLVVGLCVCACVCVCMRVCVCVSLFFVLFWFGFWFFNSSFIYTVIHTHKNSFLIYTHLHRYARFEREEKKKRSCDLPLPCRPFLIKCTHSLYTSTHVYIVTTNRPCLNRWPAYSPSISHTIFFLFAFSLFSRKPRDMSRFYSLTHDTQREFIISYVRVPYKLDWL